MLIGYGKRKKKNNTRLLKKDIKLVFNMEKDKDI